jgi:hypothetical protein
VRVASLCFFAVATALLAAAGFSICSTAVGIIVSFVGLVTMVFVIKRRTLALSFALFVYIGLALFFTLTGQMSAAMLFVSVMSLLGWDAVLTEKDISAFPKEEQKRFARRHFVLMLTIAFCCLAITLPARLFRLQLSFNLTLVLALAAIFLLSGLFRTIRPLVK